MPPRRSPLPILLPLLLALGLNVCLALPALAHKVTVFAYVEGKDIVVEAFYSKTSKVNQGRITVQNAASHEEYLSALTDEAGTLRFPVPAKALAAAADLRILLVAGEGHQNETLVLAKEFAGLLPPKPVTAAKAAPVAAECPVLSAVRPQAAGQTAPPAAPPAAMLLDEAALTRIVEQAVDSRMGPVNRLLAESAQKGPGPTEIVGGIGYIVGLFGVAAFVASRRKDRQEK